MPFLRIALVTFSILASAPIAAAQSGSVKTQAMQNPPRTLDGRPDLQGVWTNESATRLERANPKDKLVLSAEQAKKFEDNFVWNVEAKAQESAIVDLSKPLEGGDVGDLAARGYAAFWLETGEHIGIVKGEYRSSWITVPEDGQLPYKEGAGPRSFDSFDGPETRSASERCLSNIQAGPVLQNFFYNNNHRIVQTPGYFLIHTENLSEFRIVPIVDGPDHVKHGPSVFHPWLGDGVGWYEGDTLVIETINFNRQRRSLVSPSGKLTERFTRWSENQILYEFEVDDPELYTQTWKGEMSLNWHDEGMFEFACHEANYSLPGILAGARRQESIETATSRTHDQGE